LDRRGSAHRRQKASTTALASAGIGRLKYDPGYPHPVRKPTRKQLDALVEQAIVDCYNDDEQLTGLYTMIADNLMTPFSTQVLGVDVTVEDVDLRGNDIVAICARGAMRQAIPILELPLPNPPPAGAEWIDAYRHWVA